MASVAAGLFATAVAVTSKRAFAPRTVTSEMCGKLAPSVTRTVPLETAISPVVSCTAFLNVNV